MNAVIEINEAFTRAARSTSGRAKSKFLPVKRLSVLAAVLNLVCTAAPAAQLGSAFTYQGGLNDGTNPANGRYDLRFTLYDSLSGGAQAGAVLNTNAVAVSNGLFALTLDFGNVFDGNARWLEIAVKTNGAGSYTTLSPRQPLTPTPYALYAPSAGAASTSSSLIGTLPDAQLSGNVALRAGGNAFTGNQNISSGNLTLGSGNVGIGTTNPQTTLDVNGGGRMVDLDLQYPWSHLAFNAYWDQSLPAWRRIGVGFASVLQHHDDIGGFDWWVGGSGGAGEEIADLTMAMHVATNGNIGIGTFYPQAKLEVAGNLNYSGQLSKLDVAEFGAATVRASDFNFGSASRRGTPGRALVDLLTGPTAGSNSTLVVNLLADWPHLALDGNVGINNWNSRFPLSLGGTLGNTKLAVWDDGANAMGFGVEPGQFRLHLSQPNTRFSFLDSPDGNELATILGNGNVGIGTAAPTAKLQVAGAVKATSFVGDGSGLTGISSSQLADNSITAAKLATTGAPGPGQVLGYNGNSLAWQPAGGASSVWSLNGTNAYYSAGKVGIGTAVPSGKLTVATADDTAPGVAYSFDGRHAVVGTPSEGLSLSYSTTKGAGYLAALAPGAAWKDLVLQASTLRFLTDGGTTALFLDHSGTLTVRSNVGIGTLTPGFPLEVVSANNTAIVGRSTAVGSVGLYGESAQYEGVRGVGNNVNHGAVVGVHNSGGDAVFGTSSGRGVVGQSTAGGTGVFGTSATFEGVHGEANSPTYAAVAGVNLGAGPGIYGESQGGGYGGYFVGRVRVCSLEIAGGCDLAEPFPMKEENIGKGSVVVIDDEHPGQLRLSARAYDTRVAGVISGANGINPGIALHQEGALDRGENVALTGRVYVKADASFGAIRPGDLLTTSDTPGHAMKVVDHPKAQGAILGKAMSALPERKGMVLVLVTLQ